MRKFTISEKCTALVATAVGGVGMVVTIGVMQVSALAAEIRRLEANGQALHDQALVDRNHDALRADVSLLVAAVERNQADSVRSCVADIREHSEGMQALIRGLSGGGVDPRVSVAARALIEPVREYARLAEAFAQAAESGGPLPNEQSFLAAFDDLTEKLDKDLGHIAQVLEAESGKHARSVAASALRLEVAAGGLGALAIAVLAYRISRSIRRPLISMSRAAAGIANGNVKQNVEYENQDELGAMATSLRASILYLQEVSLAADALSRGDLSVELVPRSGDDVLAHSFSRMKASLKTLVGESTALLASASKGSLGVRARHEELTGAYGDLTAGMNALLSTVATPLTEAQQSLEALAKKNLTARMTGIYEGDFGAVKTAFNGASSALATAIGQVALGAEQVARGSSQITSVSQQFARSISTQAASLEDVASSLQQVTTMSQRNAESAEEARTIAGEARDAAEEGETNMSRLSEAVHGIKAAADETARIVKTIDDLAFQTNLLALNAAVEAARAGEAGRGFAVVAEEVRSLALRSAEAAQSTAAMLAHSVARAEEGVRLNSAATESFQSIGTSVRRVVAVIGQISQSSHRQSAGVLDISRTIDSLTQETKHYAAMTEETAASAENLSVQASQMQALTREFRLMPDARLRELPENQPSFGMVQTSGSSPRVSLART